jgi:hypothetical protein
VALTIAAHPARLMPLSDSLRSTARTCCGVQCARLSCGGTLKCGAVSWTHLERTLCMCVKIAATVRVVPGDLPVHGLQRAVELP